jgi:hypothetical protein
LHTLALAAAWLYAAAAALWLAVGFAPIIVRLAPGLVAWLEAWGLAGAPRLWLQQAEAASYQLSLRDLDLVALQNIFSLLNWLLGATLLWLRPRNRAALLLAVAMLGIAAVFNLPAHNARFVVTELETLHTPFHYISGMAYIAALWLFPTGRSPRIEGGGPLLRLAPYIIGFVGLMLGSVLFQMTDGEPAGLVVIFGLIIPIAGLSSQGLRYAFVSDPLERLQSRLLCLALLLALGLAPLFALLPLFFSIGERGSIVLSFETRRLIFTVFPLLFAIIPLTLFAVIVRFRLWDVERLLNRTMVYGALLGGLALAYVALIALLQLLFESLTGPQSTLVVVASTVLIAALFAPLRRRVQRFIDRRFYREQVDAREAFAAFSRELRTIIDLPELLRALVTRTADLLHSTHGAVFLRAADGSLPLVEARGLPAEHAGPLELGDELRALLEAGQPVARPDHAAFPLLLPLLPPRPARTGPAPPLAGVLALGPRRSAQRYSREDQALLLGLADQGGAALAVAQLVAQQQAEAQRQAERERRLEAHRSSPLGRAEAQAQALLDAPHTALAALHRLAGEAARHHEAAQQLEQLPRAISALDNGEALIGGLASGFGYLVLSQADAELLPVGLRTLLARLELPQAAAIQGAEAALPLLRLCQRALASNSTGEIAALAEEKWLALTPPDHPLAGLARALPALAPVAEALRAAERVDGTPDKLAYLAGAVERLSRADRLARATLGGADLPIVQRIAEGWLACVSSAIGDLQARAQLFCTLLTRQAQAGDAVSLALRVRNSGRGAVTGLQVVLAPDPEYAPLGEAPAVARLASGEEAEVTLQLRPRLGADADLLRARFLLRYADPRGPDQAEQFADEVRLLAPHEPFRYIPNPYVVGAPLGTGSPLFFGRADLLAFIAENLAAAHRNNLVLIGQRRTGKTSLLKQLPARLGDAYVPVYLDGQSLGLDPGMASFFLALATEIANALEDRGLAVERPDPALFAGAPAAAFEQVFLQRVRQAVGDRHVLLLLDEFEELEAATRRGALDLSVFGFLRHLAQHAQNLSVVFCGTRRLEELAADYWSALFNIALYRHVGFLARPEAERLIEEPVAPFGMRYDGLALEKIWRVTAGHPYFLQMLCHSLVNRHNRSERGYVTVAEVNAALDEILAAGEAHFLYLWAESTPVERVALALLSRRLPLGGSATSAQLLDALAERGAAIERRALAEALRHLALRDILEARDEGEGAAGEAYRWKLGLLGLWVEKYRSLGRALEELRS